MSIKVHIYKNEKIDKTIIFRGDTDNENNTTEQMLHLDDSIRVVKNKILKELENKVSYKELYLFTKKHQQIDPIVAIETVKDVELDESAIKQILNRLQIDSSEFHLPEGKKYSYDELKEFIFENGSKSIDQEITIPVGQKFENEQPIFFEANPLSEQSLIDVPPLFSFENSLLMNFLDPNMPQEIHVCLAKDVFEYHKSHKNLAKIAEIFFPFLYKDRILNSATLEEKSIVLLEESNEKLTENIWKLYENVDFFYDIYRERKTELPYIENGIKSFFVNIESNLIKILHLDTIFKNIHATKTIPFIKYNPGFRRENVYRLYSEKISTSGKKIPFLSQNEILKLSKETGKTGQISMYMIQDNIQFYIHFNKDGKIIAQIVSKIPIQSSQINEVIQKYIQPEFEKLNILLYDTGYTMEQFVGCKASVETGGILRKTSEPDAGVRSTDADGLYERERSSNSYKCGVSSKMNFDTNNVEQMDYGLSIQIQKKMDLEKYRNCISSLFDVSGPMNILEGIKLRFKRVENYEEMDQISLIINNEYSRTREIEDVIRVLMRDPTVKMTEEQARDSVIKFFGEHTLIRGNLLENAGFPVVIKLDQTTNILDIYVEQINRPEYIPILKTYFDSILRIFQYPETSSPIENIAKICTDTLDYKNVDKTTIENLIAPEPEQIKTIIQPILFEEQDDDFFLGSPIEDDELGEIFELEDQENQEPESQEPESQEPESQEPEPEPETQEPETQEPETPEPETQEPETQEPETPEPQEPETPEPEPQETPEPETPEPEPQETPKPEPQEIPEPQETPEPEPQETPKPEPQEPETLEPIPETPEPQETPKSDKKPQKKQKTPDSDDEFFGMDVEGGGTSADLEKQIEGKNLKNPNPFQEKIEKYDPALILKQDQGKYSPYSRVCPPAVMRQPVLLTEEEKSNIDNNHPNSYSTAIQYGSEPNKQHWYICPRYWSFKTNSSLSEEEVAEILKTNPNAIIPAKARIIPKGSFIYEFNAPKEHLDEKGNYLKHYPGFIKGKHPDGYNLPCCFKREQDIENVKEQIDKQSNYVIASNSFPLPRFRWGFLPPQIQAFFKIDYKQLVEKTNNAIIKKNTECLLRYGIEQIENQSFLGFFADLYAGIRNITPTPKIKEFRQILLGAINLDMFVKYHNGSLIRIFMREDNREMSPPDIQKYKDSWFAKALQETAEEQELLKETITSYENFLDFLSDESSYIDHTYLWDIITQPNENLIPNGLNLIILEIHDNVEILCPTSAYSSRVYDSNRETVILLKQDEYYEPIYLFSNTSKNKITRTFSKKNTAVTNILKFIEKSIKFNCKPHNSLPSIYDFKRPLSAQKMSEVLLEIKYQIYTQVINFQTKIVGFIVSKIPDAQDSDKFFVPCSPSTILDNYDILFLNDVDEWKDYLTTIQFLSELRDDSEGRIKCSPKIKIIENDMIIGILTETNQYIRISPSLENIEDNLESIEGVDYIEADKAIFANISPEKKRIQIVQNIRKEGKYYRTFRNTMRELLSQYETRLYKIQLMELLDNPIYKYTQKLDKTIELLKKVAKNSILFDDQKVLECDDEKNAQKECERFFPQKNMIMDIDNETLYYSRLADELLRFQRIRMFLLEPKYYLNLTNINYKINPDEVVLLESILRTENLSDLRIFNFNDYIHNISYEIAEPDKMSEKYSNMVEFQPR